MIWGIYHYYDNQQVDQSTLAAMVSKKQTAVLTLAGLGLGQAVSASRPNHVLHNEDKTLFLVFVGTACKIRAACFASLAILIKYFFIKSPGYHDVQLRRNACIPGPT